MADDPEYVIDILGSSRYPVNKKRMREVLAKRLRKEFPDRGIEIGVRVVGSRKMKYLNKKYRKKDYATNVLSFPVHEDDAEEGFVYPENGLLHLGDTVICYPVARDEAGKYNMLVDDYIDELVEHSLEHLLGRHHGENY